MFRISWVHPQEDKCICSMVCLTFIGVNSLVCTNVEEPTGFETCRGRHKLYINLENRAFSLCCIVVLLYCCIVVLLYCCIVVLLYCCTVVLLLYCTVRLLYCCIIVPLYCCTVVLLYCCTVVLLYCCTVVLLYCSTVVLLYCCIVVLLYCCTVVLLYCCIVSQCKVQKSQINCISLLHNQFTQWTKTTLYKQLTNPSLQSVHITTVCAHHHSLCTLPQSVNITTVCVHSSLPCLTADTNSSLFACTITNPPQTSRTVYFLYHRHFLVPFKWSFKFLWKSKDLNLWHLSLNLIHCAAPQTGVELRYPGPESALQQPGWKQTEGRSKYPDPQQTVTQLIPSPSALCDAAYTLTLNKLWRSWYPHPQQLLTQLIPSTSAAGDAAYTLTLNKLWRS
jgi:hypothetical protein